MQQLNLSGQTKTEIAIDFLREHEPPEGYAGFYSGGKDSEVLKHLAMRSGVRVKWFYSLMPDPPEVLRHIKKYHPDVVWLRPDFSFWQGIVKLYPPRRNARWCCNKIKEKPGTKIGFIHRILGIRAEESRGRAKQGFIHQRTKKRINYHPIFDWLTWELWEYIERNHIPTCSLYDDGFDRLGCIVCPMRTAKQKAIYRNRFPSQHRLFEKACYRWWELKGHHRQRIRGDSILFSEFIDNWYNEG